MGIWLDKNSNAYLKNVNRLQDVIAAIQAMGTYKFYKLDFKGWADRISADEAKAAYWKTIFEQHPEFFRLDTNREKASLVWRRQHPRRFDVDQDRRLSSEEIQTLTKDNKTERISRDPLTSDQIQALIKTAIELHSRAIQESQEKRWWIPILSILGALLGAILGAFLRK